MSLDLGQEITFPITIQEDIHRVCDVSGPVLELKQDMSQLSCHQGSPRYVEIWRETRTQMRTAPAPLAILVQNLLP